MSRDSASSTPDNDGEYDHAAALAQLVGRYVPPAFLVDATLRVLRRAGDTARLFGEQAEQTATLHALLPQPLLGEVVRLMRDLQRLHAAVPHADSVRGSVQLIGVTEEPVSLVLHAVSRKPFRAWLAFEPAALAQTCASAVLEDTSDVIFTFTRAGVLASCNQAAARSLGAASEACIGRSFVSLLDPAFARSKWRDIRRTLLSRGSFCGELTSVNGQGSPLSLWCTITPIYQTDKRVSHWVVVGPDLDQYGDGRSRLMQLAFYDGLTGLPNRRLFSEHLKAALRRAERHQAGLAVLFVDLDRVVSINESLGRETGDALLREVSLRLSRELRSADVLARLGADDFGIVLEEVGIEQDATRVCHKLLAALTRPFHLLGHDVFCGANIGVALHPAAGTTDTALVHSAELAVVHARVAGRNKYVFYSATLGSVVPGPPL